jgi:4-amino-4-deoxy-L-arabinose transferase-like glycosyltransferase
MQRPQATFAAGLVIVALAALAVRVSFVKFVEPEVPEVGDAAAYHLLSVNLADGRGYIRPFDDALLGLERPTAEYPPLFPAVLALPAWVGADGVEDQRVFLAFVGAGTVVLVGLLGRRVGGRAAGLTAASLAALYPMLFQSEGTLMAEALYAPLVTASLLLAYRALDRPGPRSFAALGLALGLAALTRAEGLLLAFVLVVPLCARLREVDASRRVRFALVALGAALVVIAPWTIRNALRLDAFVPISNNAATLIDGASCDATYAGEQLGLWRETFSTFGDSARERRQAEACFEGFDIGSETFDEASVAREHLGDGLGYARDHLGSTPRVAAVRVLRTWGMYAPRQQVDFESLEGRPRSWQMAGTVMFWALVPFAVAGVFMLVRRSVPVWPLVSTVVVVTVTAALTYGQQRFRIAAEPALLVTAAVPLSVLPLRAYRRLVARSSAT